MTVGLPAPPPAVAVDEALERSESLGRRLTEAAKSGDPRRVEDACREFESLFIYRLLRELWNTIPKGGALAEGVGAGAYRDMYQMELARYVAKNGGIGLADMLVAQLAARAAPQPDGAGGKEEDGAGVEAVPSTDDAGG